MNKLTEAISLTVKLTRHGRPEAVAPPVPSASTAVSLLRGRWTCRQSVQVIRVEGPVQDVREALQAWESRGFTVDPAPDAARPAASPPKRLNPRHAALHLKSSRRSDGPNPAFRESRVCQEIES